MAIDHNKIPRDAKEFSPWQDMDGAPRIYGCDHCGKNIMPPGSEFRPNKRYTFCDEDCYETWARTANGKTQHWGRSGCAPRCSCGWDKLA